MGYTDTLSNWKKKPEKNRGFNGIHLQQQYKYELFYINFTSETCSPFLKEQPHTLHTFLSPAVEVGSNSVENATDDLSSDVGKLSSPVDVGAVY